MELIRKWWSVLRVVIITSGVISLILWYVAKSQCTELNCPMTWNTLGLLVGGWAVFYVAVKRVMSRLYCPLRKLQSLIMIFLAIASVFPLYNLLMPEWTMAGMSTFLQHNHILPFSLLMLAAMGWVLMMFYFQFNPTLGQESVSFDDE